MVSSRPIRYAYAGFGLACVGVGTVGILIPGLPTTVFFILALWAFKRSNRRLENWLLNHRVVGPTLRDWEENKVIRPRTKVIAVTMTWLMILVSVMLLETLAVQIMLLGIAIAITVYLLTRKSNP